MQLSFSKIIFFLTLLCSVAFAGGIEEDSSPDEISETTTYYNTNIELLFQMYLSPEHETRLDLASAMPGDYTDHPAYTNIYAYYICKKSIKRSAYQRQ